MPLHISKRPNDLKSVVGNDGIKDVLQSVLGREDKPHVFLLHGPKGTGKTTIARIIGKMLGCSEDDIIEKNCAQNNGIDAARELQHNAQYSPMSGDVKFYVLDEAHALTKGAQGAQNSLLKLLEDTPSHTFFALCTTDPDKLLPAIVSRCVRLETKNLPSPLIVKLLNETLESEGIEDFPNSVLSAIVKAADGCPRQAIILLDTVIDIEDESSALRAITDAFAAETASIDLCRLLLTTNKNRWNDARFLLKGLPDDAEKCRYAILGYMAAVLISDNCKNPEHVSAVIDLFSESCMYSGKGGLYNAVFLACKI